MTGPEQKEIRMEQPEIDCVIIGINTDRTLAACIESVLNGDYPRDKLNIIYVDGGSNDASLQIATTFPEVTTLKLDTLHPSPGLGRNRGWEHGHAPLVQFLDSDTIVEPTWLLKATQAIQDPRIGAVLGLRKELRPHSSIFNQIADFEWNGPAGESDCFGGDVMIRRSVLEHTKGYDEVLVGGEDPELSRRVIRSGWRIWRIQAVMTYHDLNMHHLKPYLKRAYRSGYGFAAVRRREAQVKSPFWRSEALKILVRGLGFLGMVLSAGILWVIGGVSGLILALSCLALGVFLLFRPRIMCVPKLIRQHAMERKMANAYGWHCSVVVLPQLMGMLRFYVGSLLNRPLRNASPQSQQKV